MEKTRCSSTEKEQAGNPAVEMLPLEYFGYCYWSAKEFAICMGWEAFRLAISGKTRRAPAEDVIRWLQLTSAQSPNNNVSATPAGKGETR